jgi:hypothetical protein
MSDRMVKAYGPKVAIQSWDKLVPIGTPCEVRGVKTTTWSHAGYGRRNVPSVFVEAFQEPIPLSECKVAGIEMVSQKGRK